LTRLGDLPSPAAFFLIAMSFLLSGMTLLICETELINSSANNLSPDS